MEIEDLKKGDIVYYLGDLKCIVTKVCKTMVKISDANEGWNFVNKLVYPCYLHKEEEIPQYISPFIERQNQITREKKEKKEN